VEEGGVSAPDFGMVGWSLSDAERDAVAAMRERHVLSARRREVLEARDAALAEAERLSNEASGLTNQIHQLERRIMGRPAPSSPPAPSPESVP
jgi:hypothetical protein